ncbi:MAG: outer membrane beta-barrel protein [Chitinophagaceae bacterium]|nr:outer membrane beta-barrel protein [Chitinophagaceae bacterium]MCW5927031.1 outer membrane beta-barrel protein [Chitinophagaceae bacterium]
MSRPVLLLILLTVAGFSTYAQRVLKGRITNTRSEPLPNTTVLLLKAADSVLIKGTLTDEKGQYVFEYIAEGTYLISASLVSHETVWTPGFTVGKDETLTLPAIVLAEGIVIEGIVVKGTKRLFELKQDRIVMNISASPAFSGNTGLELLQKTPGVVVDRQNNSITMNAKGEVLLMINNKIQRIPVEVLMAKLEGMRAENIEQIEIIHQPPAKYDASGAAGIIHIVLKENDDEGTNGTVSLYAGYGQREKAGLNLVLNSRKGKWNWYGGYNFNTSRSNKYVVDHFREYEYQGDLYYHENYVILRNMRYTPHTLNLGLDVNLSKNTEIGFQLNGSKTVQVWGKNMESISNDYVNGVLVTGDQYSLYATNDVASASVNAYLAQKISAKSQLNFNLDYMHIRYDNASGVQIAKDSSVTGERATLLNFWILSLDNVNQLKKGVTLEAGIKGTFNGTGTALAVENSSADPRLTTHLHSGKDDISERILAGYVSLKKEFSEKLNGELGLRYEHYAYDLQSQAGDGFVRTFKNLFPTIRFNYKIDSLNSLQLTYNRPITRPPFFNLTSFLVFFDPSLTVYANPRLRPSFTNNFTVTYQRRSVLFSLAYLRRTGQVYFYNTVNKDLHLQISVPQNLDLENMIEASLIFPLSPAKWWKMNWTLNGLYHTVKDASSHPSVFRNSIFSYAAQLYSSFTFGKGWSASIDGQYRSKYLSGDQEYIDDPYLNLGLKKIFPSGNSLGLLLQDITNSMGNRDWEYHQPDLGVRTFGHLNWSERQIRITYTHVFGNKKLKGKKERNTGAEEVKSRM